MRKRDNGHITILTSKASQCGWLYSTLKSRKASIDMMETTANDQAFCGEKLPGKGGEHESFGMLKDWHDIMNSSKLL